MNVTNTSNTKRAARVPANTRCRGFTLVEVIVAVIVVGLIAASVSLVVGRSFKTRTAAERRIEASSRAQAALDAVLTDARNLHRESDPSKVLLQIKPSIADSSQSDLLMLVLADRRVRPGIEDKHGPVQEVQYRVAPVRTEGEADDASEALWRRTDPLADEYPDAGGVAAPIAPGVTQFVAEAFDGQTWAASWDSDIQGLPLALRVTIFASAGSNTSSDPLRQVPMRAVVPIERTPKPASFELPPADEESTAPTSTTPTNTSTPTAPSGTPTFTPSRPGGGSGGGGGRPPGTGGPGGGQPPGGGQGPGQGGPPNGGPPGGGPPGGGLPGGGSGGPGGGQGGPAGGGRP